MSLRDARVLAWSKDIPARAATLRPGVPLRGAQCRASSEGGVRFAGLEREKRKIWTESEKPLL